MVQRNSPSLVFSTWSFIIIVCCCAAHGLWRGFYPNLWGWEPCDELCSVQQYTIIIWLTTCVVNFGSLHTLFQYFVNKVHIIIIIIESQIRVYRKIENNTQTNSSVILYPKINK